MPINVVEEEFKAQKGFVIHEFAHKFNLIGHTTSNQNVEEQSMTN